jgi:TolB-like protein/AraC-like DNA-binding protein
MENQPSMGDVFLSKIFQLIDENLGNEEFSVEHLASEAGLSRSMLHRKLIKLTGKSASDLITEKRLEKAKELLENDVATASEIAYRVGFSSPSYFNKVFHKHYNVSPGSMRKNQGPWIAQASKNEESINKENDGKTVGQKLYKVPLLTAALLVACFVLYVAFIRNKSGEKSIAVLPLHNLTGQAENDYFVDGMHDALIGELGQISSLRVISRTSTLRYRNSNKLLKDIANELGVKNIVEGSVTGAGDSLRILIQLIDVSPKERHLFANEYRDGMRNVLNVQSKAIKDIAQKIDVRLSKNEKQLLKKSRVVNPETYKAYLRGMYYLNEGTEGSFDTGIQYLQEAIKKDPGDPYAYAGLAVGYTFIGHGQLNSEDAFLHAMSAAKKAIKLDPSIDEAHTALAILYLYDVWDWAMTKEFFESAIVNNMSNDVAHAHFAWYFVLFDDMDKTIYHAKQAALLEPFSPAYCSWLALLYWYYKQYDQAEIWAKKALKLKGDSPYGNLTLSWINLEKKQFTKALEYIEKMPKDDDYCKMLRGYVYVKAGKREKAMQYWNELKDRSETSEVNTCYMGMMAAYLGFTDLAFELLNNACEKKYFPITYINFYPSTENIRKDARYDQLLRKMNLPASNKLMTSK